MGGIDYSVSYRYTGTVPAGAPEPPKGGGSYNIGQVLEVAPVPTMPGYVLYGWTTEDVAVQRGQFIMPDSNVEFTGEWRKANYNVIYVYQGNVPEHAPAAPMDTRTYQVGDTVTVLPAPELAGYTFSGWTTSSVEVIDGAFAMPTGNVVLRGSWTPITYSVSFRYEGDVPLTAPALPETAGYCRGDTVAVPPVAAVEGFTFRGWSLGDKPITEGAFSMPAKDVEVVGTWARNSYPVKYRYEGKVPAKAPAPPAEADHLYEASVAVAAKPQTTGYLFSGWASTDVTPDPLGKFPVPAGPVTFTGSWSLVIYNITYELGGGTMTDSPTIYTIESPAITFAVPTREGYTFSGWYADSAYTTQVTGIPAGSAGDLTLYAKWRTNTPSGGGSSGGGGGSLSPATYTLKFEVNGGTPVASLKAVKNSTVKLADHQSTRAGHLFLGWFFDERLTKAAPEEFKLTENVTLYAKWEDLDATLNRSEHMAYIVGFEDGTIRPEVNITRAEVAMIFYRLLTAEAHGRYDTTDNGFTDSADGDWYNTAVSTLAAMGVIQGRGADQFDPAAPITRGEFAAIAARFDSSPYNGPDIFGDITGHWAANEISRAALRGWVQGDGSGMFQPDALITRAEVVTTVNRVLNRKVDADGLPAGHREFPDNELGAWYYCDMLEAAIGHKYQFIDGHECWA